MSKEELIRQIRAMISAEYDAIKMYTILAENCDDESAKKLLMDIADEERIHAGEFLNLLMRLDPTEEKFYSKGSAEADKKLGD